ncbi:MAG: heavy-metal-associated domain-containing protein [Bacteriovorax sp.]|nr:heavy-metal-associated domain-containing protein [Bacteriovorax sp.]
MGLNKSVSFKVNGMHCGGCANKIIKSIEDLKIEHSVDVNVSEGKVKIKFNAEESSISTFKESITKLGFQVEKVELE